MGKYWFKIIYPCHQSMARSRVLYGGDGLQTWRVAYKRIE